MNELTVVLAIALIFEIALACFIYLVLKTKMKCIIRKKGDYVCNISATTVADITIYDIPAVALNHEVDTVPANMKVVIKEIRPMIDGRWFYIEFGSQVGFCKGNSLLL